jgi:hypothetical protein
MTDQLMKLLEIQSGLSEKQEAPTFAKSQPAVNGQGKTDIGKYRPQIVLPTRDL